MDALIDQIIDEYFGKPFCYVTPQDLLIARPKLAERLKAEAGEMREAVRFVYVMVVGQCRKIAKETIVLD